MGLSRFAKKKEKVLLLWFLISSFLISTFLEIRNPVCLCGLQQTGSNTTLGGRVFVQAVSVLLDFYSAQQAFAKCYLCVYHQTAGRLTSEIWELGCADGSRARQPFPLHPLCFDLSNFEKMPRKAKPTKHSSAELNKRAAASLVSDCWCIMIHFWQACRVLV